MTLMTLPPKAKQHLDVLLSEIQSGTPASTSARATAALTQLRADYPHMPSLGVMVSRIRKSFKTAPTDPRKDAVLQNFNLTQPEWTAIATAQQQRRRAKVPTVIDNTVQQMIAKAEEVFKPIPGYVSLAQQIINPKTNTRAYQVMASIAFLTGRRSVELFQTGTLTHVGPHLAKFVGQAKQKDGAVAAPFDIIILGSQSADDLQRHIQTVRNKIGITPDMTTAQVNAKVSGPFRAVTEKLFDLNPHALRAAYADACDKLYRAPAGVTSSDFRSMMLGHQGPTSAVNYERTEFEPVAGRKPAAQVAVGKAWRAARASELT